MDQLVQFLFKHERAVFTKGRLTFEAHPSLALLFIAALLVAVFVYFIYVQPGGRISGSARSGLIALRIAFISLLIFLLMRPVIIVPSVIANSSDVAILADSSRSMQLADQGDRSRLQNVERLLVAEGPDDGSLLKRLADKFRVDLYGFAGAATKLQAANELEADGTSTDLATALQQVVRRSTSRPLAGVVVISDGATNAPADLAAQLRELQARRIPVYTIGVGSLDGAGADAEMVRVTVPRRVLIGSSVTAEALVRLSGYGPTKLKIAVSENGRALKTQEFEVRGGETRELTLVFTPPTAGDHRYTFAVTPLENELTVDNNAQEALVQVTDKQPKILYMEGEPRWEYGKLRQSLGRNEKNVVLVSVLRSADGKFYRQGVESDQELKSGFPSTEEELFKYQGLILGSIEANFFTFDQLKNVEQFVARRGGGFLALGGRFAFDAGKYAGTPVADLLPLYLNGQVEGSSTSEVSNFKAVLTPRSRTHAITRLNEDPGLNQKAWNELPPITVPERLSGVKPGATVLLEARGIKGADGNNDRTSAVPLLIEERYGRGRSLALTASDTWRWRMEMDSGNTSHENFWRQMLRYLVSTTPEQTEVAAERDVYTRGETVRLRADVNNSKYETIADAQATARITRPSGATTAVPLQFSAGEAAGGYKGEFTPDEPGLYRIDLTVANKAASFGLAQSSFLVTAQEREFYNHWQNADLLKRVAAETGGKYYPLERAGDLIEEITYRDTDNSELVTKELWDMPINFFLLIALISAEWFLRKQKGLA